MNRFDLLRRQLQSLSDPQVLHDLHNLAGRDIAELVQAGFAGEHDPDGAFWVPSRAAQRENRKTLRDTGALQDGIRWKADSRAVIIRTSGRANRYAASHQYGTRNMPIRRFLPEGEIPVPYQQKLTGTFRQYFLERFGRA